MINYNIVNNNGSQNNYNIGNYTRNVTFAVPGNKDSLFFKPMIWCAKQWSHWGKFDKGFSIAATLKKIILIVPLVFATLGSAFIGLIGLVINPCSFNMSVKLSSAPQKIGSNNLAKRQYDLDSRLIKNIDFQSLGNLYIKSGSHNSLTILADDNLLDLLEPQQGDEKLSLKTRPNTSFQTNNPIIYKLTVAQPATSLSIKGSGHVYVKEMNVPLFSCDINGSGKVDIQGGKVDQQVVKISGSGHYNTFELKAKDSKVNISGSGVAKVNTQNNLDTTISGSGKCCYKGNPHRATKISGSGSLINAN